MCAFSTNIMSFCLKKFSVQKLQVNQQFMRHQSFTTVTLFPQSHQMVRIRFVSKCIN